MLKITLYRQCALNDNYQVGISKNIYPGFDVSFLDMYLNSLYKKSYELESVYYENSGILNFDYGIDNYTDIYNYNYMKAELFDDEGTLKLVRYCFINKIEIKNEIVYLYYSEDIFHSYYDKINQCLPSFLSRKRYKPLEFSPTFHLPVEYLSNNNLIINQIEELTDEYYIFAQLQPYDTAESGEVTSRYSSYVNLTRVTNQYYDEKEGRMVTEETNIFSGLELIEAMQKIQNDKQYRSLIFDYNDELRLVYYDISDIYAIPKKLFNNIDMINFTHLAHVVEPGLIYKYGFNEFVVTISKAMPIYSKSIKNNFKRLKLGTLTQNFDIVNNGTTIELVLELRYGRYNFALCLYLGDSIIDISDSFRVELPFDYLNGDVLAQQKIQRQMATINGVVKLGTGIVQTALDIASYGGASGISAFGTAGQKITTKIKSTTKAGNTKWRSVSKNIPGKASALDIGSDAITGIGKIATGITDLIEVNAPVYSSSRGNFSNVDAFINLKYGLISLDYNYPDNEDFVNNMINNTGYIVYGLIEGTNQWHNLMSTPLAEDLATYDVIKFDYVNVVGNFTDEIAEKLNEIFEKGIKISYLDTPYPTDYYNPEDEE